MAKPFESRIQDLVYNVDVGIGLWLTKILLYVLFVVGVAVLYQVAEFRGLKDAEAMDQAQLARNLALTGSFTTQNVRPASMWYLRTHTEEGDPQIMRHPDIVHAPMYATLLSGVFRLTKPNFNVEGPPRVFPPESTIVLPVNHLLNIVTGLFVFLLGRHLFDRRVALLAMTAFFLSNKVWAHSTAATSISAATCFTAIAIYIASKWPGADTDAEKPATWPALLKPALLAGFFCGLAFLTRYATAVLVPAFIVYFAVRRPRRGWAWASAFLLVFLLVAAPWLARNKVVSGGLLGLAPHTALNDTKLFSDQSFERSFEPKLEGAKIFRALQAKWMSNFSETFDGGLRTVGDGLFVALFLTAFFFRFNRPDTHVFRWCMALAIGLLFLIGGYFGPRTMDLLHIFLPIVLVYGTGFFFVLLARLQMSLRILEYGVVGALLLLSAIPLLVTLMPPRATLPYPPYFPPYHSLVSKMLDDDELLCTDMPWATAWYGRHTSLYLPVTLDEFYTINDYHKRISGLYFTTLTRDKPFIRTLATGPYRSWFPILQGQTPADFPLRKGFPIPPGSLDQIFLTDRIRWER